MMTEDTQLVTYDDRTHGYSHMMTEDTQLVTYDDR